MAQRTLRKTLSWADLHQQSLKRVRALSSERDLKPERDLLSRRFSIGFESGGDYRANNACSQKEMRVTNRWRARRKQQPQSHSHVELNSANNLNEAGCVHS